MDRLQSKDLLQAKLEALLGSDKVYFQPPDNVEMVFPCITFEFDDGDTQFADNTKYFRTQGYQVTVIDRDPNSGIPGKVDDLLYSEFRRSFKSDGLNHSVFKLFF